MTKKKETYSKLKETCPQKHGGKKAGDVFKEYTRDCIKQGGRSIIQKSVIGNWKNSLRKVEET